MNYYGQRSKKNKAICPDISTEHKGKTGQRLDACKPKICSERVKSTASELPEELGSFLLYINLCCVQLQRSSGQVVRHKQKVKETTRHCCALCQQLRVWTVLVGSQRLLEDVQASSWMVAAAACPAWSISPITQLDRIKCL